MIGMKYRMATFCVENQHQTNPVPDGYADMAVIQSGLSTVDVEGQSFLKFQPQSHT